MNGYRTQTDQYNVLFKSHGKSDRSAMPLGNGRCGISLWVEEDGDLQFYIGHSDAQSEMDRNLKLGKIILKLHPNPFTKNSVFSQCLHLREGCVRIKAEDSRNSLSIRAFIDVAEDRIYVEVNSSQPIGVSAKCLNWRIGEKSPWEIPNLEEGGLIKETADCVIGRDQGILFYHKNGTTCVRTTAVLEALSEHMDKFEDTLYNRTFGGYMTLSNGRVDENNSITSKYINTHHLLSISLFCKQSEDTEALLSDVVDGHLKNQDVNVAAVRTATYWDDYFGTSYIFVHGDEGVKPEVPEEIAAMCKEPEEEVFVPSKVTQSYLLTKYMFACCGKGKMPIHFNGMIFNLMPGLNKHLEFDEFFRILTAQPEGQPTLEINPDEKGWEFCINLWQNVRLPYAAMMARGEFESMKVLFAYYRRFWEINKIRAKIYYQAEGQYNTEMTNSFGLIPASVYGTERDGLPDGYAQNRWGGAIDISPGLELCFMMLDYYEYTQDIQFLKTELLPYAEDLLHFIETRFKEREDGKIILVKLNCVETYFDTTNPITVIAGMQAVTDRILKLPIELTHNRSFFKRFKQCIPDMPLEQDEYGNMILAPAKVYDKKRMNVECPVLYPVYPFRIYTHYRAEIKIMLDTFKNNNNLSQSFRPRLLGEPIEMPCYSGWQYQGLAAALLGMVEESKEVLINNCSMKNPGYRFPAMWGPVYDAVPDNDHGANITNLLQLMVMQNEGDRIYLLPAWPREWDVSFRLFTSKNTVVECDYKAGKFERIFVTPENRRKDIVIC